MGVLGVHPEWDPYEAEEDPVVPLDPSFPEVGVHWVQTGMGTPRWECRGVLRTQDD